MILRIISANISSDWGLRACNIQKDPARLTFVEISFGIIFQFSILFCSNHIFDDTFSQEWKWFEFHCFLCSAAPIHFQEQYCDLYTVSFFLFLLNSKCIFWYKEFSIHCFMKFNSHRCKSWYIGEMIFVKYVHTAAWSERIRTNIRIFILSYSIAEVGCYDFRHLILAYSIVHIIPN